MSDESNHQQQLTSLADIARRLGVIESRLDTAYLQQATYLADMRTQAERDRVHSRRLDRLEQGQARLLWAIITAFGMIILLVGVQVIGALLSPSP